MKLFLKFIGYFLLAILLVILGGVAYYFFSDNENRAPISVIPESAVLIVETENVSELLNELTQSTYWSSIIEGNALKEAKEGLVSFDEQLKEHKWLMPVLRNQKVAFALHQVSQSKSDFMLVVDVKKYANLNLIPKISSAFKLPVSKHLVDSVQMYTLTLPQLKETVHLTTIDNLLIGSSSYQLLEKTIKERNHNHIESTPLKNQVYSVFTKGQINVYTSTGKLQEAFFKDANSQYLKGIAFTALGGNFSETSIDLHGYSSCNDSISSPFIPLLKSQTGNREAEKVIPSSALFYLNFNVADFNKFYDDFLVQYSGIDPVGYATYMGGMKITESFLGISMHEDFFSWMSGEIAMAKLKPVSNAREYDFIVAIKANEIETAHEKLDEISKKIKNRTSVKFKKLDYKNHEINYLNIRGFFKVIMGNFFVNREKPYYTIVDDYVIFSNSSDMLIQVIDSYLVGNTLERNQSFKSFNQLLKPESHISAYLNMHKLYEHLYYYGSAKERREIKDYKDLLQKIGLVGLQMYPDNNLLRTQLITKMDTSEKISQELELIALSAEEIVVDEFKTLDFKIDLGDEFVDYTGDLDYYLTHPQRVQDSVLIHEGELDEGELEGLWRTYFYSGNIKSTVNYEDGEIDGTAIFYFDNEDHVIRAEMELEEDVIDGEYKEFYVNGNIKANIEFRDGQRWGDALYYYRNGKLKIDGQFKKGKRSGNWKYYSTSGELLKKENW
ncbi:DUF3352 domain-containing protein [Labilibacter sediminis]|nr:DUF3352 domain-containing protein [Labilibacter sediminis]